MLAILLTLCTLCMMRVLLLVCVGPTLFLASNSFKAESVTTSPPFVNCSENTTVFSVNPSSFLFNKLMLGTMQLLQRVSNRTHKAYFPVAEIFRHTDTVVVVVVIVILIIIKCTLNLLHITSGFTPSQSLQLFT